MQIKIPYSTWDTDSGDMLIDRNGWNDLKADIEAHNKMLGEGVEIYQDKKLMDSLWDTDKDCPNLVYDHTALLINLQPIKKETAEDVLRDMIEGSESAKQTLTMDKFIDHFKSRAKAVLEPK